MRTQLNAVSLPVAEKELAKHIKEVEHNAVALFKNLAGNAQHEKGCNGNVYRILDTAGAPTIIREAKQRNIVATAVLFTEPLKEAHRDAQEIPVYFYTNVRSAIKTLALDRIHNHRVRVSSSGTALSNELINNAVNHWLDTDMNYLIQSKDNEWYQWWAQRIAGVMLLIVFLIAVISLIVDQIRNIYSRRRQAQRSPPETFVRKQD